MTYYVEELVAVECDAICQLDAVCSLLEQLMLRFVAESPRKYTHG